MVYFSRLTDIVTCSLSRILEEETNPQTAILQIIQEMEDGLAGAERSAQTALTAEQRIRDEIATHEAESIEWMDKARLAISAGNEELARSALVRKQEMENIIAGLNQQLQAAVTTREHLTTTQRALAGRLAEAYRKRDELISLSQTDIQEGAEKMPENSNDQSVAIEMELEALKRELGKG